MCDCAGIPVDAVYAYLVARRTGSVCDLTALTPTPISADPHSARHGDVRTAVTGVSHALDMIASLDGTVALSPAMPLLDELAAVFADHPVSVVRVLLRLRRHCAGTLRFRGPRHWLLALVPHLDLEPVLHWCVAALEDACVGDFPYVMYALGPLIRARRALGITLAHAICMKDATVAQTVSLEVRRLAGELLQRPKDSQQKTLARLLHMLSFAPNSEPLPPEGLLHLHRIIGRTSLGKLAKWAIRLSLRSNAVDDAATGKALVRFRSERWAVACYRALLHRYPLSRIPACTMAAVGHAELQPLIASKLQADAPSAVARYLFVHTECVANYMPFLPALDSCECVGVLKERLRTRKHHLLAWLRPSEASYVTNLVSFSVDDPAWGIVMQWRRRLFDDTREFVRAVEALHASQNRRLQHFPHNLYSRDEMLQMGLSMPLLGLAFATQRLPAPLDLEGFVSAYGFANWYQPGCRVDFTRGTDPPTVDVAFDGQGDRQRHVRVQLHMLLRPLDVGNGGAARGGSAEDIETLCMQLFEAEKHSPDAVAPLMDKLVDAAPAACPWSVTGSGPFRGRCAVLYARSALWRLFFIRLCARWDPLEYCADSTPDVFFRRALADAIAVKRGE